MTFADLFGQRAPVIGVLDLPPLPGSLGFVAGATTLPVLRARAVRDAEALSAGGCDAVLLRNGGDAPFAADRVGPETVAALTLVAAAVADRVPVAVGISVLRNDACAAVAIAALTGAQFVRIPVHYGAALTDDGLVEGHADETLRLRGALHSDVLLLADLTSRQAAEAAYGAYYHGLAHALVLTRSLDDAAAVRAAAPEAPLLVACGLGRGESVLGWRGADGLFLDRWQFVGPEADPGEPLDAERVRAVLRGVGR
jgi:membrane complex biogenesis BtpA family protein